MKTTAERLAVPLPMRLRTRPRDALSYPIPWIVVIDRAGQPQFTINDHSRVVEAARKRLCALCGKRHDPDGAWFIGGPRCFLHPQGAFLDPPAHLECAEYALRVCPFLAVPSYTKRIDDRKLSPENTPEGMTLVWNNGMPEPPPERFGLGRSTSYEVISPAPGEVLFVPTRWDYVEFWRHGEPCDPPDDASGGPAPGEERAA